MASVDRAARSASARRSPIDGTALNQDGALGSALQVLLEQVETLATEKGYRLILREAAAQRIGLAAENAPMAPADLAVWLYLDSEILWLLRYTFEHHEYVHRTLMTAKFVPDLRSLMDAGIVTLAEPLAAEDYAAYFVEPWMKGGRGSRNLTVLRASTVKLTSSQRQDVNASRTSRAGARSAQLGRASPRDLGLLLTARLLPPWSRARPFPNTRCSYRG